MQADRNSSFGGLQQPAKTSSAVKLFTWPLSKGVTAEVRFTGGEVQPAHLDLLAKYLELAKAAIETEDDTTQQAH